MILGGTIMENSKIYADISKRTGGDIYIGVVGPVRTGKSTFVKRFMDLMVLPNMEDTYEKNRAQDELPQSSGGKTITTTEPKFIPKEAAHIHMEQDVDVKIRLIDCVGYMVEGAVGHMEEDIERMVKTPWFSQEIPFTKAAEIGTDKVINEHSTIGFVITTDGSIGDLKREHYIEAEEKTIHALKRLNKPFLVLLNSKRPYAQEVQELTKEIEEKYGVSAVAINCEQLTKEDIHKLMEHMLHEFPISCVEFYLPKWVEILEYSHPIKKDIMQKTKENMSSIRTIKDIIEKGIDISSEYIKQTKIDTIHMWDGCIKVMIEMEDSYYYGIISELVGENIESEYQLMNKLQDYAAMQKEYKKVLDAMNSVRCKGYGVVTPERGEIVLDKPEVIRHGNKFGVKIKAESPSIHMIRANIITEIAPIVGTQEQADDLIRYIADADISEEGIWETNIFGKTVEQLVQDGISSKITMIGDESQIKLQETMQKIVNDSNGRMVCIII